MIPIHKTLYWTIKAIRSCKTDQLFSYFVGVLGLSGMVYVYLYSHVIRADQSNAIHVDRETLEMIDGGRNAIWLKKAMEKGFTGKGNEYFRNLSRFHFQHTLNKNRKDNTNSSEYKFLISDTKIKLLFKREHRTKKHSTCKRLFNDDEEAIASAKMGRLTTMRKRILNSQYKRMTSNCPVFIAERGYVNSPVTEVERDFPIAFSIIAYKQVEQIERLLRAIYRPQNFYCIHLDNKTLQDDVITITSIADCFPNVFMSSRSIDVRWGNFSVLEAELVCMEDLWKKKGWKYFINLTGQEFPLKTNLEIVRILSALKGANVVDGTWVRARQKYLYRWTKPGKLPPHRIFPIKGSVHICVNRDFVDFALHDQKSIDFLEWLKETEIPDETFFPSLNHNPSLKIPGSFLGEPEEYPKKPTFTRYKNWKIGHGVWARSCSGKYVRNICILGVGDLSRLKDDISLFVNKFHISYQYLAYACTEDLIYQRTRDQYLNKRHIDVSFYELLDQVKLRYVKPETKEESGLIIDGSERKLT